MLQQVTAQAAGRINIIGEHTDYNKGYVLPAAINKRSIATIHRNGTPSTARFTAQNLKESYEFDLSNFDPIAPGWQNYVMGVVHELQALGGPIEGFDCSFEGDVPIGGGMSSSAALECSIAVGLNKLFDLQLDDWQIIRAAQAAEHNFVGIKCGIMDQFSSVKGKENQVMLLDCHSLDYQYFPFELGKYQLLLLNTNVSHSLASTAYNDRRAACEEGVQLLQKKHSNIQSLRDVSVQQLMQAKDLLSTSVYNKCKHVILENERVLSATEALLAGNFSKLGELIYQSHFSLQYDYEVSCPELDFLVQQTFDKPFILGSRMMGGGFGGCTLNIIEKENTDTFVNQTKQAYQTKFGLELSPYLVSIEDGAKVLEFQ